MTLIFRRIAILLCLFTLSACATVSKGTHERVLFETVPPGAAVVTEIETTASKAARRKDADTVPEYFSCAPTPCEIRLSRRTNTIATLTYPGMEPLEFAITSGASRRNLAPNATGGLAAGATIAATGALINSTLGAAAVSAGAMVAPAAVVALAVGGSMALVDVASGAGLKLSPNPLSIVMVPKGTEVVPDPEVEKLRAKANYRRKDIKMAKEVCIRPAGYNTPKQRNFCMDWKSRNLDIAQ